MRAHIIMFAKAPVPGRVKTRLARDLGHDAAARLHAAFLSDLTDTLVALCAKHPELTPVLSAAGDPEHPLFLELESRGLTRIEQTGDGLGDRLERAVAWSVEQGAEATILIGSDAPMLGVEHFEAALDALRTHDVAISPSSDGGYTTLGLKGSPGHLFTEVPWSSAEVFGVTLRRAGEDGRSVALLPLTFDVDTLEDFHLLRAYLLDYPPRDTTTVTLTATIAALRGVEV